MIEEPVKKKRGRPPLSQSVSTSSSSTRKPGRPKQHIVPVAQVDLAPGQAKRLRKARKLKGYTHYQLARRSGVAYSTIRDIEEELLGRGTSTVNIMQLALALEEDPGWLAFGTGKSVLAEEQKAGGRPVDPLAKKNDERE